MFFLSPRLRMDNLTIRQAQASDAPRLAELSAVLGYPVQAEVFKSRLERLLARADHVVFVAEIETKLVVGWIHGAEQDILAVGRVCEIWGLVVDQAQRNRGVGRRLIEAMEQWATKRGLDEVSLRSNVIRPESHPFYERLGYVRFKTQHAYRKRLDFLDQF
jgi:GNAT superfamily N-acetyltransferase